MISKDLVAKTQKALAKFSAVQAVYLYGSYAEERANKYSDLDLGVLLDDGYNQMVKLDILTSLSNKNFTNVDLVILNQAPPLLRYEIVKNNQLIYARDDFDAAGYFSLVIRKYFDFRPYLEIHRKYLKERILNGQN
ncbi:MAG: nucleotidyltransferase domain-containing protein [Halanaerobium sp.]|nr:nucleotidyltransferase domain-containing protein [Halanaerobium sp.]